MDESGLFYNNVPRGSLSVFSAPALKQIRLASPWLISATPRWLKDKPDAVQQTSRTKAWMTTTVFRSWLRDLGVSMREQKRPILLLVGNAPSHSDEGVTLTNIRVESCPPALS
eukprot:jgi/Phyca11/115614/e_gw1.28.555.1